MTVTILISAGTALLGFTAALAWGLRNDIRRAVAARRERRRALLEL